MLLAKAVNKFPGGTPKRWEKIADMVGRSVNDVRMVPSCSFLLLFRISVYIDNKVLERDNKDLLYCIILYCTCAAIVLPLAGSRVNNDNDNNEVTLKHFSTVLFPKKKWAQGALQITYKFTISK